MQEWRSYHVYYTDLDRLLLECVGPFLRSLDGRLSLFFWERHFAGGPHLRVRFRGTATDLNAIAESFVATVEEYLQLYPSNPISNYSMNDARQMLEMEAEEYEPASLEYRVNAVSQQPYQRLKSRFVQGQGLELLHEFLHDSNLLSEKILENSSAKRDALLRLYFLNALFPHGDIRQGSVSFKSHWSGFAASFPSRPVVDRIRSSFEEQKDLIIFTMLEVKRDFERSDFSRDPILREWMILLDHYGQKATAILGSGEQISATMTPDEVRKYRKSLAEGAVEPNEFMKVLLEDERFVAAFRHEQAFAWPRVLTNLLYMMVPALGLTVLDKMALCYFAHRAVEAHFRCDLTEILRNNIAKVVRT